MIAKGEYANRHERRLEIHAAIRQCQWQIAYWTAKKAQALNAMDRTHAGVRLLAWQYNERWQLANLNQHMSEGESV